MFCCTLSQFLTVYGKQKCATRVKFRNCEDGVTVQLNDLLQVNEDVLDVFGRKDAVSVQPLAKNTVQDPQHAQVGALSVEELCSVSTPSQVRVFGPLWVRV